MYNYILYNIIISVILYYCNKTDNKTNANNEIK